MLVFSKLQVLLSLLWEKEEEGNKTKGEGKEGKRNRKGMEGRKEGRKEGRRNKKDQRKDKEF